MSARPNIYAPEITQQRRAVAGFHADRAALGPAAGMERLGMSLWILPPGQAAYPYHFHLAEEEALVVLEGTPALRTPDGLRTLERGEVVAFPRGEAGAHQVINESDAEVRFLAISTAGEPEIAFYPDECKVGVWSREPGVPGHLFRLSDAVDYNDGVEPRSTTT